MSRPAHFYLFPFKFQIEAFLDDFGKPGVDAFLFDFVTFGMAGLEHGIDILKRGF